jgi:hypothetical protein
MAYLLTIAFLFLPPLAAARAVCPICTVVVCASVGLSRWLGVDDTITGLWIGGLAVSLIIWTVDWLNKKNIRFMGRKPLIVAGYYFLIIWPLYHYNMIGHPLNKLWGVDKLLLGITLGSIGFIMGVLINHYLKKINGGQAYFPFQKVVMPVSLLAILNLVLYLICAFKIVN